MNTDMNSAVNACIANGIMRESLEAMEKACILQVNGDLENAQYYYELSELLDKKSEYYKNVINMHDPYENKKYGDVHYTRYLASWLNRKFPQQSWKWEFQEWLDKVTVNEKPIPEEIKNEIYYLSTNGKIELEVKSKI